MAKKKPNKKPRVKKTPSQWELTVSQQQVLVQMGKRHNEELNILKNYQSKEIVSYVDTIRSELKITPTELILNLKARPMTLCKKTP